MAHKLLIKTHNTTGLKYLCYTRKKDHEKYTGSGKLWKRHIQKHGYDVTTELLFETEDFEEFRSFARKKSEELDVVSSKNWANLRIEDGDGGDTVSDKVWITNGTVDVYHIKTNPIPEGWRRGRSKCVFNDKKTQSEFSKRSDRLKAAEKTKERWANGEVIRDHSKCGTKGDDNPSKRPENRKKISDSMKQPITVKGICFDSKGEAVLYFKTSHKTLNKWLEDENRNKTT